MSAALLALESANDDLLALAELSSGRKLLALVALERVSELERQIEARDRRVEALVEENRALREQLDAARAEALRLRAFMMQADMGGPQGEAA